MIVVMILIMRFVIGIIITTVPTRINMFMDQAPTVGPLHGSLFGHWDPEEVWPARARGSSFHGPARGAAPGSACEPRGRSCRGPGDHQHRFEAYLG